MSKTRVSIIKVYIGAKLVSVMVVCCRSDYSV